MLLPETGRLEETSLPRLLLDLHRARFNGTVALQQGRMEKILQFREGFPVFAESNLRSESLASHLMQNGTISRDAYAQVVDRVDREGCKEGRVLLDLELLPPRDVFEALKEQVRCRLLDCFAWSRGTFHVSPGAAPPDGAWAFRADFFRLLQEGIETRWSSDRIFAELAPRMGRYATPAESTAALARQLQQDAAMDAVLDAIDGNRTLWQLTQIATTPRSLAAIWLLDAFGAFTYAEVPASGPSAQISPAPEIEIVVEDPARAGSPTDAGLGREAKTGRERPPSQARTAPPHLASPAAKRLVEDIASKFAHLGEVDYYSLLGVDSRADANAIKRAYVSAAKDFHPDTLARSGIAGEVRAQASRVFAEIGKAYTTLSRAESRREYDALLAGDDLGIDAEQIATAETLYRKGEILLRQGNFRGALEFLLPAVEIYPDEADYQNATGWALYRQSPSDPERAKPHLERAVTLAPKDAVAHFRLGVVLRSLGESDAAQTSFTRARQLDPMVG